MRHSSGAFDRRPSTSDTVPVSPRPAHGTSAKSGKRVRFIDESFAQELITREKARLELKIQQLRNLHIFTTPVVPPESILKTSKNEDTEKKSEKRQKKKVKVTIAEDASKKTKDADNHDKKDRKKSKSKKKKKTSSLANKADDQKETTIVIPKGSIKNKERTNESNAQGETSNDKVKVSLTTKRLVRDTEDQTLGKILEDELIQPTEEEHAPEAEISAEEAETTEVSIQAHEPSTPGKNEIGGKIRGINYQRLNELATPKGKVKPVLNARRRKFMATASPDHLKLTIPYKTPRTIPQLKNLSQDEIDYMVQPKTIREFQLLTLMRLPPQKKSVYANGGSNYYKKTRANRQKTPDNERLQSAPIPSNKSGKKEALTRGKSASSLDNFARQRDKSSRIGEDSVSSARQTNRKAVKMADESKDDQTGRPKPSFKFAAMGVMSMVSGDGDKPPKKSVSLADIALKAFLPTHKRHAPLEATAPPVNTTRASEILGDRTLRLRPPRRPAWEDELEARAKDEEDEYDEFYDDTSTMYSTRSSVYSTRSSWSTVSRKSGWSQIFRRRKKFDFEQLTKDLDKCTYLRGVDEKQDLGELDVTTIFANLN